MYHRKVHSANLGTLLKLTSPSHRDTSVQHGATPRANPTTECQRHLARRWLPPHVIVMTERQHISDYRQRSAEHFFNNSDAICPTRYGTRLHTSPLLTGASHGEKQNLVTDRAELARTARPFRLARAMSTGIVPLALTTRVAMPGGPDQYCEIRGQKLYQCRKA